MDQVISESCYTGKGTIYSTLFAFLDKNDLQNKKYIFYLEIKTCDLKYQNLLNWLKYRNILW